MGPPANLPSFDGLAATISQGTSEARLPYETQDRFLGRLKDMEIDIHDIAAATLSSHSHVPTILHDHLVRLFPPPHLPRIVTTNFDLLFEQSAATILSSKLAVYRAPALPLGRTFNGIVHLHGSLADPSELVLTDADFGRAYLTEGWARRFLVDLFRHFSVMFVGYSHNDTVMSYLSRALPMNDTKKRFALTADDDSNRWQALGIEPITYPLNDRAHSALSAGVNGLAEYVSRGALEWQQQLTGIAKKGPDFLDEEEIDLLDDAFSDVIRTRFFTAVASDVAWIGWLDKRKHLTSLFHRNDLSEPAIELADWLADTFVLEHSNDLIELAGKHHLRLHPALWARLARSVGLQTDPPLSPRLLAQWVVILLDSVPEDIPTNSFMSVLHWLSERCNSCGLIDSLMDIFRTMSKNKLTLSSGIDSLRVTIMAEHYHIHDLWERLLKPHLGMVAEPILSSTIDQVRTQHRMYNSFDQRSQRLDVGSLRRSAIEPHSQDRHPEAIDVLIDAARDCLEHLASSNPLITAHWCEVLASSEAPLLRRLAVHTLPRRSDLSNDDKIDWLLARMDLHDLAIHHEAFQAMRILYPKATNRARRNVVSAILDYEFPREDEQEQESLTAGHHFDWLDWLLRASPDCEITKVALDRILARHPDFRSREHSDFTFWVSGGFTGSESPWSVQDLLSKPAADSLSDLLSYQQNGIRGPSRRGLLSTVQEAAARDFPWGMALADLLASSQYWDSDLWPPLLRSWSTELDENSHRQVLDRLCSADLLTAHIHPVVEFLLALLKDGGMPYASSLLLQANRIALEARKYLQNIDLMTGTNDWLLKAINHPAGTLAEFWLQSLATWHRNKGAKSDSLFDPYLQELSAIAKDNTLPGVLGKAVLCTRLPFLLSVDYSWSRSHLVPWFTNYRDLDGAQAAWHGFIYGGRLNPQVAEVMTEGFLSTISKLGRVFPDQELRAYFIERYAATVIFFADDPLVEWIPKFFLHANTPEDRRQFAWSIGSILQNMEDAQQEQLWQRFLKRYWQNRILGVPPPPLESMEVKAMIDWLPNFTSLFPSAVALAIETPGATLDDNLIIHRIGEKKLWQTHPESTARLLIHLGLAADGSRGWEWHGAREIVDMLLQLEISDASKRGLKDLVARLGL